MVKIKSEIKIQKKSQEKRVRGQKSKPQKIKNKKIEKNDLNNLLIPNIISEDKKYSPEDRSIVLFGLLHITEQIKSQFPLPDKFLFSTIALFDYYLNKVDKNLNRNEMKETLYSCLDIIDKEINLNIFNQSNFKSYINIDLEYDILEIVDLEIYPEKIYDHFSKFYYDLEKNQKENKSFLNFLYIFKKKFLEICFLLLVNNKSINKKPIINFISCLLLTCEKIRKDMPIEAAFLENYIKKISEINNYYFVDFIDSKNLINESIYLFKNLFENYC